MGVGWLDSELWGGLKEERRMREDKTKAGKRDKEGRGPGNGAGGDPRGWGGREEDVRQGRTVSRHKQSSATQSGSYDEGPAQ